VTQAELTRLLDDYRVRINARLDHYSEDADVPPRLREAVRYCLLAPGKRIRPVLTLLACQACGGEVHNALPVACAVELVHTYSLIHDDLPAMDDDDVRRGRPTCHKQFDEATAILAGDALLTLAFEVLADMRPAELGQGCVQELARAAGMRGMIAGQVDDILNEGNAQGNLDLLQSIHRRKTGALLGVAVRLGALVGGGSHLEALSAFAEHLGLAFQIKDDLLDVQSSSAVLGKGTQKDSGQGKLTYPGLLGVAEAQRHLRVAFQEGRAALMPLGKRGEALEALLTFVVERDR
jgi:geranylgeranyl diphosphate synthase type II